MSIVHARKINVYAVYGGDNKSPWIRFCFPASKRQDGPNLRRLAKALAPHIKVELTPRLHYATFVATPAPGVAMTRAALQGHFFALARGESWKVRGEDD